MRRYVVGFLFSEDRNKVVLIRKTHPEWQAGKLNGPGGKVEESDETPRMAMSREFNEEVGVKIPWFSWSLFCSIQGTNGHYAGEPGHQEDEKFQVDFFYCFGDNLSNLNIETDREEKIEIIEVSDLSNQLTVSNCQWLVPMALTMADTPVSNYLVSERY